MKKITSALVALGLGVALSASVQATSNDEAVAERIKAVGSVCIEGDDTCGGAAAAPAAASGPRSGADVYTAKCASCHAVGVAGAPKFGTSEWTYLVVLIDCIVSVFILIFVKDKKQAVVKSLI